MPLIETLYGHDIAQSGWQLDVGGIVLAGRDAYCNGHVCKDFSGGQTGIPKGPTVDLTLTKPVLPVQGNGAPVSPYSANNNNNNNRTFPRSSPSSGNSNYGSGGGGASQQLIGLYQSSYVSALSNSGVSVVRSSPIGDVLAFDFQSSLEYFLKNKNHIPVPAETIPRMSERVWLFIIIDMTINVREWLNSRG
jgi:hypothetical protein